MQTILFDVDGVFLSEERYFDASALCIWEILGSENYLGLESDCHLPSQEQTIRTVRELVFDQDQVLQFMKSRGINSNWDMVFLQVSYQLVRGLIQLDSKSLVEEFLVESISRDTLQFIGQQIRMKRFQPDYASFSSAFEPYTANKHELFQVLNEMLEKHFHMSC